MYFYTNFTQKLYKSLVNLAKEQITGEWRSLAIDITNFCNLRCPFCYNDWHKEEKPILMKKDTFAKIIEIFPLIHKDIYLSCNYEPTLHPQFTEFLNMIPPQSLKKCFFTTNLTDNITDSKLEEYSNSGIHHINISLDSFNPTVYESFRKGARFEHFISNLDRLVSIFSKNHNAPSLRYITMVFKQNVYEVPCILEKCKEKYLSSGNEFRSSDYLPTNNWSKQNEISNYEWEKLLIKLNRGKHSFSILRYDDVRVRILFKIISKLQIHSNISIDAMGLVNCKGLRFDIETIPNPYVFFKKQR